MATEALLDHVPIPPGHVHRMRGEIVPQKADDEYEIMIREVFQTDLSSFDLVLLGLSEDGHTASLFPGTDVLQEEYRLAQANWAPHLQIHRGTFTSPLINVANAVAFLSTGESKARVLREVLEPEPGESARPAAMVRPTHGTLQWFLSEDATRMLKRSGA